MVRLSAQQLAELAPCSIEYVQRLADLGLLGPRDDDGLFPSSDVHAVRLMGAFEEAGIPVEDVARGVAAGELRFPLGLFLPEPAPTSGTYAELADRLGRPPELLRRLSRELGLPPPADDRVRDEDAEILSLLVQLPNALQDARSIPGLVTAYLVVVQAGKLNGQTPGTEVARRRPQEGDMLLRDRCIIQIFSRLVQPAYLRPDVVFAPLSH